MKKLYTLLLSIAFAANTYAQGHDVAVVAILQPDTMAELPMNFNDTIGVAIANYGDSLVSGDTITVIASITITGAPTIDSAFYLILPISQVIPPGTAFGALSQPLDLSPLLMNLAGQDVELCLRTSFDTQTDVNPANDEYCYTYTVEATPASIASVNGVKINSFYSNGMLNIENNKAGNNVTVYSTNGQVVFQSSNGNSAYNLNLSKGMYIVNIANDIQILNNTKILVD